MKNTLPILIVVLLGLILVQEPLRGGDDSNLSSRLTDLEKRVAVLEKVVNANKNYIYKFHDIKTWHPDKPKWQKLAKGMSHKQVNDLLGKPATRSSTRGRLRWTYKYDDKQGFVTFKDGVLESWREPQWDE